MLVAKTKLNILNLALRPSALLETLLEDSELWSSMFVYLWEGLFRCLALLGVRKYVDQGDDD